MHTHETYVSLETAKLLKQAGFDWEVNTYYEGRNRLIDYSLASIDYNNFMQMDSSCDSISAPTLAVAQKWLREVKDINLEVMFLIGGLFDGKEVDDHYYARAYDLKNKRVVAQVNNCTSKVYESALEAGINECLTILLKQKK